MLFSSRAQNILSSFLLVWIDTFCVPFMVISFFFMFWIPWMSCYWNWAWFAMMYSYAQLKYSFNSL